VKKSVPLSEAVARIPDGAWIVVGGFMGSGSPHRLIDELVYQRRNGLTLISNDTRRNGRRGQHR